MADIDLVIFDLDGTLVDTAPDIAGALGVALDGAGVAAPPLAVVKEMVGDGARELIRRALKRAGADADIDALHAAFLAAYRAHVSDRSIVYSGITETLAALRAAGVATAVLTNKPGDIARRLLQDLSLADRFVATIGDGDGFARKPDPAAARSLVATAGTQPARTAVVGDGVPDVRTARALGARAIAATWGYVAAARLAAEQPDALAATPTDAGRLLLA
ncbi:MAG TPA: HAD hydrolase-like protein [Polyangia bacterium]|nr:HAD hydrolase-like protein [Polyangia bacterium]